MKKKFFCQLFLLVLLVLPIVSSIAQVAKNDSAGDKKEKARPLPVIAAQIPPAAPPTAVPVVATQTPRPVSLSAVKVIEAYKSGPGDDNKGNSAGIGDLIVVKVKDLQTLVNKSNCLDKDGNRIENCTDQEIALYLDGRKINGIVPESGAPSPTEQKLRFRLQRTTGSTNTDSNDKIWADLLGAPPLGDHFFERPTEVSVGLADDYPVGTDIKGKKSFDLIRIRKGWFWLCSIVVLFLFYFIWRLAIKSDILRDSGPTNINALGVAEPKPYSLARCQMAFWFFWVIASFFYLWLITGAYDIITTEALALIGIGAGTALGAAAIDASKREEITIQQNTLEAEKVTLTNDIAILNSQINAVPSPADVSVLQQTLMDKNTRLNLINNQIKTLVATIGPKVSRGWYDDILTDTTGISFHRFQIAVWTIVLGILFIYSVWNRLSMPEFGATLLALQGISAGTYLGFKIPEKQS